jgi:hypothetical protein
MLITSSGLGMITDKLHTKRKISDNLKAGKLKVEKPIAYKLRFTKIHNILLPVAFFASKQSAFSS